MHIYVSTPIRVRARQVMYAGDATIQVDASGNGDASEGARYSRRLMTLEDTHRSMQRCADT